MLNVASLVILSLFYNICIQKLIISAHKQCFTSLPLPLYRYHFTVTSVMVKVVKFLTFNSSTNISIHALQLHVCIANVHLNSLDNIYCTFEKLFFYTLSLPLPAVSAGMAHIHCQAQLADGRWRRVWVASEEDVVYHSTSCAPWWWKNTNYRFSRFFVRSVPLFRSLMLTPIVI